MEESCRRSIRASCMAILMLLAAACKMSEGLNVSHPLRFWLDEYAFSAGETTILREEVDAAGKDIAIISGESYDAFHSLKGYYAPEQWDVYWTGRQGCLQSLAHAMPGHKISCVPGLHELTLKDRLIARLTQFYGEGAFDIIPRSFLLPTQYWPWRLWLANQEAEDRGEMWVLKKEVHRGKGVFVLPLNKAIREGKIRNFDSNYDLAQAYVANQLTVLGRKFYVRLWAVVTSSFPLRAYLFDGGVVVFGNSTPDDKKAMTSDDFIVNLWHLGRNTEAAPWSVAEFRTYLDNWSGSKSTFDKLWLDMRRSLGLTFAAGVQAMRFSAAAFPIAAAGATFELVGIDFIVDEHLKPWLLEVNAVPSLARKVINCDKQPEGCTSGGEAESVFDVEKERLVHSLFQLLKATAGTGVYGRSDSMARPPNLAEYLARWKSNATDLAMMNQSNSSSHSGIATNLGWTPVDAEAQESPDAIKEAEAKLRNDGRELRSSEQQTSQGSPGGEVSSSDSNPLESGPAESDSVDSKSRNQARSGLASVRSPEERRQDEASITSIARRKKVVEVTGLNKYVPEEQRVISTGERHEDEEAHQQTLKEHLLETSRKEVDVALANQFLPLMMVPEAAEFSAEQQTRGHVHPQPEHKYQKGKNSQNSLWAALLLPFRPVISAYGGLAGMLERLRVGLVYIIPEINNDVTMALARVFPGADWLILKGYQTFSWGDRDGIIYALSVLPKHKLDQQLSDYLETKESKQL